MGSVRLNVAGSAGIIGEWLQAGADILSPPATNPHAIKQKPNVHKQCFTSRRGASLDNRHETCHVFSVVSGRVVLYLFACIVCVSKNFEWPIVAFRSKAFFREREIHCTK
jgi:hypothetical protein